MGNMIKVGMADMNLCHAPDAITTLGLGSCVGVVLYDPNTKIAGLVHIMLPDSTKIRNNDNCAKFADTGIEEMVRRELYKKYKLNNDVHAFSFTNSISQSLNIN